MDVLSGAAQVMLKFGCLIILSLTIVKIVRDKYIDVRYPRVMHGREGTGRTMRRWDIRFSLFREVDPDEQIEVMTGKSVDQLETRLRYIPDESGSKIDNHRGLDSTENDHDRL